MKTVGRSGRRTRAATPSPAGGGAPRFRILGRTACASLLGRNTVGRLAFSLHDRVDIEPLHYVFDGGWLYGRTSPGSKLLTIPHNHWVAFEVDEIDGVFDWRSVVVHGALYVVSPDVTARERRAWDRGIQLLRCVVPDTGAPTDPVPFRTVVFRIHADEMTGRAASFTARRALSKRA